MHTCIVLVNLELLLLHNTGDLIVMAVRGWDLS